MPTTKNSQFAESAKAAAARDKNGKVIQGAELTLNCGHVVFRKFGHKGCKTICEFCRGKQSAYTII